MLYAPFLIGAARGGVFRWDLLALLALLTVVYLARLPAATYVAPRGKSRALAARWLLAFGVAAVAAAVSLRAHPRLGALLGVGLLGAVLFAGQIALQLRRRERSASGELLGIAGLALAAPLSYAGAMGESVRDGFTLWALNVLFFGSSVFYVKWRVRRLGHPRRPGSAREAGVALVAYHVALLAALAALAETALAPWGVLWAYLPLLARYLLPWLVRRTPTLLQIGAFEVVIALAFVVLVLRAT